MLLVFAMIMIHSPVQRCKVVSDMKLSIKIMLIFSCMMLAALLIFSYSAAQINISGARAYTVSRFRNMSVSIARDIEQDFSMMQWTMRELTGNITFMSALNQFVRDDSEDQKMGIAASKAAISQFYQSPLVDNYFRVSFYTREGLFITSHVDKADTLMSGTAEAAEVICALPWLDKADASSSHVILSPHKDYLSPHRETLVYGIVQRVLYKGKPLGYIEISNECFDLERITGFLDSSHVVVQAIFGDGAMLFSNRGQLLPWSWEMPVDALTSVGPTADSAAFDVLHTTIDSMDLHLYIAQDSRIAKTGNEMLRRNLYRQALYIILPTIVLISLLSFSLTRSIRRLTKKVRQIPTKKMLGSDKVSVRELTATVSSRTDQEIYELEQVFNKMLLQLRDSTLDELASREGALKARLSALQAQINPHFVYNTLNIISAKSMESGNYDVIEICEQFANMLRYSTDTHTSTATMREEIENARNYLLLAKARYEDSLEYIIDVPEELNSICIPKLTLQPLVENALIHGFNGNNILRKLSITGYIAQKQLILEIRDNGTGFSEDTLEVLRGRIQDIEEGKLSVEDTGKHIGLINTCLRLYYYSKGAMRIAIRNDGGAVVTISMPIP